MTKNLSALLQELDAANPFRSAELARQLDAAAGAGTRYQHLIASQVPEQALNAFLEQQSRQLDALTQAARRLAEPYEQIRTEQEKAIDVFREQQERLASAIREQTEAISEAYRHQFAELARRQSELEATIKALAEEQGRIKKVLEEQEPGA